MSTEYTQHQKYKNNTYKFENLSEADLKALNVFAISDIDQVIFLPDLSLEQHELDKNNYTFHDEKYFHPILNVTNSVIARKIFKIALYDRYFNQQTISNLIYLKDKHAIVRGKSDNIFDRLDTYRVDFELRKDKKYTLRHHGTKEGGDLRQAFFKDENLEYGLLLQHGPNSSKRQLESHFTKRPIEGIKLSDPNTKELRSNIPVQYHHAKYSISGSTYKTKEPSQLLGLKNYKNFSQEEHVEILGCIILTSDEHDTVHIFNDGGINIWLRWSEEFGYTVPFHWRCEENYNITLLHLEKISNGRFIKTLAPSYEEFILLNS